MSLLGLLPLALMPCLYAVLVKLAALLFRRTKLRWSHALIYGVLALLVGVAGAVLNRVVGFILPLPLAVLLGLGLQVALGGWYFGSRATTASGTALEFKGGALLAFFAYLLVFAFGITAAIVVATLHAGSQS